MIEVESLVKAYPGVTAVNGISFRVEKGEIIGFLGPNGAGKSTTMKIVTCFIPPTSGRVTVCDFDVVRKSTEVRRRVGYLPENNPLYTEMRVEEYLRFRAKIKGVPGSKVQERVEYAMGKCGLTERRRSIIQTLSKGFRQRVGIADAIVHDPEIIILDEPTIGLDPIQVRQVRELIRELGQNHTVILSTHILSEVERMCGRVIIINRGKIVANGTPNEIVSRLTATGRIRLEVEGNVETVKRRIEAMPNVARVAAREQNGRGVFLIECTNHTDIRGDLFQIARDQNWRVWELALERMSLEDAFAELTLEQKEEPAPAVAGASNG